MQHLLSASQGVSGLQAWGEVLQNVAPALGTSGVGWPVGYRKANVLRELGELLHACEQCGIVLGEVRFQVNPYEYEIHGDQTEHWLCIRCIEGLQRGVAWSNSL